MFVNLQTIPAGGVTLRGEEDPSIIDISDPGVEFRRPIQYELKVALVGKMFLAQGRLETVARYTCSRCLKKFNDPIRTMEFQVQQEAEDLGGTIDLTDEIRADMILALSTKPLCKQDCLGICPNCGQDLNERSCECSVDRSDSPFEGLKI